MVQQIRAQFMGLCSWYLSKLNFISFSFSFSFSEWGGSESVQCSYKSAYTRNPTKCLVSDHISVFVCTYVLCIYCFSLHISAPTVILHLLYDIAILKMQISSSDSDVEYDNGTNTVSEDLEVAIQGVIQPLVNLKVDEDSHGKR